MGSYDTGREAGKHKNLLLHARCCYSKNARIPSWLKLKDSPMFLTQVI